MCPLQVLECGVCEDVFSLQGDKVPRLLLCGHTVCHDCLTRLPLHGRAVRCPFDRQVTELGESVPWVFVRLLLQYLPLCGTCRNSHLFVLTGPQRLLLFSGKTPVSSRLFRGFWSLGSKEELCSFRAFRAPPERSHQSVRNGRRHPERHGRGKAPVRLVPTGPHLSSPHFSSCSASSAVTRTRATRPPCTAPCVPLTCVPNAPSSPTPPAHWPNTAECRWRTSPTRRPCAHSTRSTPLSLCAWRKPASRGRSCAACVRSTANTRATR